MNFRNTTPTKQTMKSIRILSRVAATATLTLSLSAAEGPRIVVFAVSGVIESSVFIEHSNITIAGQTPPGAGLTIAGMLVAKEGISDVDSARVMPGGYTAVEVYLQELAASLAAK
jgi:hypothetical protein